MFSLRRKIILGYSVLAALLLGISILYLLELRLIERQIQTGGRISELFDATLEMRRFEKNYFLYHQPVDFRENSTFLAQVQQLLGENRLVLAGLAPPSVLDQLARTLDDYRLRMVDYARSTQPNPKTAQAVRILGMDIVNTAQSLADAERRVLQQHIDRHQQMVLVTLLSLLGLLAAVAVVITRGIMRPLKQMELSMESIAAGNTDRLVLSTHDREIASLVRASNHMLDELRLRQQQQLIQADHLASLGRLISGVAHEINNPLSNISSTAQILIEDGENEEGASTDPEWRREMLTQIDEETTRAQLIVRSLLDYARERRYQSAPVLLKPLVEETLRFIRNDTPAQVAIHIDIADDLWVDADKPRLQQVFLNLFRNAIEALQGAGEIRLTAQRRRADDPATAACLQNQSRCATSVEVVDITLCDDGQGITPEVLPRIFDPFYSTKEASRGSGLGLFIVREIVEQHAGCIAVESEPGRFTTFHIRLPQTSAAPTETP